MVCYDSDHCGDSRVDHGHGGRVCDRGGWLVFGRSDGRGNGRGLSD